MVWDSGAWDESHNKEVIIVSIPPSAYSKVLNIYVDPEDQKLILKYETYKYEI